MSVCTYFCLCHVLVVSQWALSVLVIVLLNLILPLFVCFVLFCFCFLPQRNKDSEDTEFDKRHLENRERKLTGEPLNRFILRDQLIK